MELSDEVKLIKNSLLFINLRVNEKIEKKHASVVQCLEDGADVNSVDHNDNCNTPLHIAVQKQEKIIVQILLEKGALPNQKNSSGETPLNIAKHLQTDTGKEVYTILSAVSEIHNQNKAENTPTSGKDTTDKIAVKKPNKNKQYLYTKRAGTSGVSGQFYETKLLSLVLLRALTDDDIENFFLGTNIDKVGDLDDICIRFSVKGESKPIVMCLQAKHRKVRDKGRLTVENVRSDTGDFSYLSYFDSYLKIKESFKPNNSDDMFDGEFHDVNCYLIIYTPLKDSFAKKLTDKNKLNEKMNELIHTSDGDIFQFDYDDTDLSSLTKMTVTSRIDNLASLFLYFIMAEKDKTEAMLSNELIARYHYVLAREVIQITLPPKQKNQQDVKYHIAKFHPNFFISPSEYLVLIREKFYKEMLSTRCDKTPFIENEVVTSFQGLFQNPCAYTISKLIGKMVTYNEQSKTLEIIEFSNLKKELKKSTKMTFNDIKDELNKLVIDPNMIEEAITIKLKTMEFKLHPIFGNLDLAFRGAEDKVTKRIQDLAENLVKILKHYERTKIVEINDETVGDNKLIPVGLMETNRGLGSAVGSLLIKDPMSTMFRFNLTGQLPDKARQLLDNILKIMTREELNMYRLHINLNGFPKYNFEGDEYDKRIAKEFLNKLWFYTNQAQEHEVEAILKNEIDKHYNSEEGKNQYTFKIQTDAIYLRSHDEIQKWWMQPEKACYLNKNSRFFEQAKKDVIDSPLFTILNLMYINKLKKIGVTYSEVAISALKLHTIGNGIINIVTEANDLTGVKLLQYFENTQNYTFIDYDYILSLPFNDSDLIQELKETKIQNLILVYETSNNQFDSNKLKEIIKAFKGNRIFVITDSILAKELETMNEQCKQILDKNTYFTDLTETSQNKILNDSKVVFQGSEVPLKHIIHNRGQEYITTDILKKIIKQERILIGKPLLDKTYKDIDNFIDRDLRHDEDTYQVNTLNDIQDNTVIVVGAPGMGNSSLLTHLSLNTKRVKPLPWIVRINLPDYEVEFLKWQYNEVVLDDIFIAKFLSQAALKNWDDELMNVTLENDSGEISLSNAVGIKNPTALFELELFLYLYNKRKVIFLFDAYNAICPHYENEVLKILKTLNENNKRMWVTTCTYQHTMINLENNFDSLYRLQPLDQRGKKNILNKFFSTNLKLERLNYEQVQNVESFLKYMSKSMNLPKEPDRGAIPVISLILHFVYITAAKFFESEITRLSPSVINDKFKKKYSVDFNEYTPVDSLFGRTRDEDLELADTPLHIYLIANYFKCCIEDTISITLDETEAKNKFDLIMHACTLYQNIIESHIKKICFKEEDSTNDEDIADTYKRSRKEFLEKYKKLGLFTLCRENDLNKLLKEDEIKEVKGIIERIENGKEQCGLISCIVNEIPRFGHLVFAEYFAMECLTDILKQAASDNNKILLNCSAIWHTVMNILLFNASPGLRNAFDYKLQTDPALAELTNTEICKKVVFELLLKHNTSTSSNNPVGEALQDRFFNIVNLLLTSAQGNLSKGNIDEFKQLINKSKAMFKDFGAEYNKLLDNVVESVLKMDIDKFGEILKTGQLTEVPLRHVSNYCNSETAKDLTNQVVAVAAEIPAISDNIKNIVEQTEVLASTAVAAVGHTVNLFLQGILDKLQENQPGPSTSNN